MCSEVPRYKKGAAMLGLFSDLMKFTAVIESLSINNIMFCKENNSIVSMYYQQNEKYTQKYIQYLFTDKLCGSNTEATSSVLCKNFELTKNTIFKNTCNKAGIPVHFKRHSTVWTLLMAPKDKDNM